MTLPTCCHRGDVVSDSPLCLECYHPFVRGREMVAVIRPNHCADCGYHDDKFAGGATGYAQPSSEQPTEAEYAARYAVCRECSIRRGNFCPQAGGLCSLTQKLTKGGFRCPLGKF